MKSYGENRGVRSVVLLCVLFLQLLWMVVGGVEGMQMPIKKSGYFLSAGSTLVEVANELRLITGRFYGLDQNRELLTTIKNGLASVDSAFDRCAVVGTSYTNMIKNVTKEVESFDAVVRLFQSPPSLVFSRSEREPHKNCSVSCHKGMVGSRMDFASVDKRGLEDLLHPLVKHLLLEENPVLIVDLREEGSVESLSRLLIESEGTRVLVATKKLDSMYEQIFQELPLKSERVEFYGVAFASISCASEVVLYGFFVPETNYDYGEEDKEPNSCSISPKSSKLLLDKAFPFVKRYPWHPSLLPLESSGLGCGCRSPLYLLDAQRCPEDYNWASMGVDVGKLYLDMHRRATTNKLDTNKLYVKTYKQLDAYSHSKSEAIIRNFVGGYSDEEEEDFGDDCQNLYERVTNRSSGSGRCSPREEEEEEGGGGGGCWYDKPFDASREEDTGVGNGVDNLGNRRHFRFCLLRPYISWMLGLAECDRRFRIPYEIELVKDLYLQDRPLPEDSEPSLPFVEYDSVASRSSLQEASPVCSRCVVVGNSALSKDRGVEIDEEHDCWFRFNQYLPLPEETRDLGSRTTFLVVSRDDAEALSALDAMLYPEFSSDLLASSSSSRGWLKIDDPLRFENATREGFVVIDRELVRVSSPLFVNLKDDDAVRRTNWYESTGFRTVALALDLCQTVDLYNFGFGSNHLSRFNHPGELIYYLLVQHYYPEKLSMRDLPGPVRRMAVGTLYNNPPWLNL